MVIAVDFDGTIVEHQYPNIGRPIPFAIDVLKKLQQEQKHIIILWTVREGQLLREAVQYCRQRGLNFFAVNSNYPDEILEDGTSRKINADVYIDDKNFGGLPEWGVIYKMISAGTNDIGDFDEVMMDSHNRPKKRKNFFLRLGEIIESINGRKY